MAASLNPPSWEIWLTNVAPTRLIMPLLTAVATISRRNRWALMAPSYFLRMGVGK